MKQIADFLEELSKLESGNIDIISQFWLVAKSKQLLEKYEKELIDQKENGIYEDNETSSNNL